MAATQRLSGRHRETGRLRERKKTKKGEGVEVEERKGGEEGGHE